MSESSTDAARVAVVGDTTSVAGFRPLGFAVFPVERPEEARSFWKELTSGDYAVVFMTEPTFEAVGDLVDEVVDLPQPAVTVIPAAGASEGLGERKLVKAIERALGTSTLLGEEGS